MAPPQLVAAQPLQRARSLPGECGSSRPTPGDDRPATDAPRATVPAEEEPHAVSDDRRKGRRGVLLQRETEERRIEPYCRGHIVNHVADRKSTRLNSSHVK